MSQPRFILRIPSLFVFLLFTFFALLISTSPNAFAAEMSAREKIIQRELNCVARAAVMEQSLEWDDVCYTDEAVLDSLSRRADEIRKSLEANSPGKKLQPQQRRAPSGARVAYQLAAINDGKTGLEEETVHDFGTRRDKEYPYALFDSSDPLTQVEFSTETFHYSYREPSLMKQKGYFYGIYGKYEHRLSENTQVRSFRDVFNDGNKINMFRLDGRFSYGTVDYESEGTGSDSGIKNYIAGIRGVCGYDIPIFTASRITPYAGLGYRYLLDDGGGRLTTTGHWGYDRESRYFYVPIGVETQWALKNKWSFRLTVEYDMFLSGEQESHLEDGGTGLDPLVNDQDDGYGLQGSFRIAKEGVNADFFLEPFVRYWHIDDSNVAAITSGGQVIPIPDNPGYILAGREPENKTVEFGFKLGILF
ncbi:MAG: autotransporter domain-containing protein [Candidatus Omnitrophica bacterium]|nr:autotransporter domain-containing protein [Candidatus Omnitrophota bacterium]